MDDNEKVYEIVAETCRQHPDYLFGKINYASLCLQKGESEKIPEIFDNKMALELLYPDRKKFHVTEYCSFAFIMARYYIELDPFERELYPLEIAYRYYKMVRDLDPDSPFIERMEKRFIAKFLDPEKLKRRFDEMKSEMSEEELKELEEIDKMSDEEFEEFEKSRLEAQKMETQNEEEQPENDLELSEFDEFKFEMLKNFFEQVRLYGESSESIQESADKSKD